MPDISQIKLGDTTYDIKANNVPTTFGTAAQKDYTNSLSSSSGDLPTASCVYNSLSNKVDKIQGKGLSTNDYTDEDMKELRQINGEDIPRLLHSAFDKNYLLWDDEEYSTDEGQLLFKRSVDIPSGDYVLIFDSSRESGHIQINGVDSNGYDIIGNDINYSNTHNEIVVDLLHMTEFYLYTDARTTLSNIRLISYNDYLTRDKIYIGSTLNNYNLTKISNSVPAIAGRTGKNLFNVNTATQTISPSGSLTPTIQDNGTITINTTSQQGTKQVSYNFAFEGENGDYVVSGCPETGSNSTYEVQIQNNSGTVLGHDYGDGVVVPLEKGKIYNYKIIFYNAASQEYSFAPMICSTDDFKANPEYTKYVPSNQKLFEIIPKTAADIGAQSVISSTNKLSSDLVNDSGNTHLFVSSAEKTAWNSKGSGTVTSVTAGNGIHVDNASTGGSVTTSGTMNLNLYSTTKASYAVTTSASTVPSSTQFYPLRMDKNSKLGTYVPWTQLSTPVTIANGGTGSTTPEDARLALGFKVVNKTINLKNKVFNKSSSGSYYLPEASATTISELSTICSIVIYGTAYLRNEYVLVPRTIGSANKVGFMMSYITSGTLPDTITITDNLMIDLRIFGIV